MFPFGIKLFDCLIYRGDAAALIPVDHAVRFMPVDLHKVAPIGDAKRNTVDFYHAVRGHIAPLSGCSSPADVTRFVISLCILPIKRMLAGRPWSYVFVERLKAISPSIANLDALRAVVLEGRVAGILAPFFHRVPDMILRRLRHSMCRKQMGSHLASVTTAASGISIFQRIAPHSFGNAAVAAAEPHSVFNAALVGRSHQHEQPTKAPTSQIQKLAHSISPRIIRWDLAEQLGM